MKFFCRCLVFLLILGSGSFVFASGQSMTAPLPFHPGEEIYYDVRWQMYPAGDAVVRVLPLAPDAVQPDWAFEMNIKTTPFLDKLFKVRDHLESSVDRDFSGSIAYAFTGKGKKKKQIRVAFSRDPYQAVYSNFDNARDPIDIPENCFDPLSAYFKMRSLDLVVGQTLSFPITDGKKAFVQKGDVLGKETLALKSGTWETLVITPYVTHFSGVFSKSEDPTVRVWVSDDKRRIPVRIRVRVVVGSIYLDLNRYVPGKPGGDTVAKAPGS